MSIFLARYIQVEINELVQLAREIDEEYAHALNKPLEGINAEEQGGS
jgi:hypothetical protein